jgi:hydrogenase maturation protein HypF
VLLRRRPDAPVAPDVAPGVDTLGVMLPYTPLHRLLLDTRDPVLALAPAPRVLIMTSGNFSEEPIATRNDEARERLAPLADALLLHDREIETRCDDSVVRTDGAAVLHLRRSRGYAPYPVALPFDAPPVLAVGGELKNTICLARERYAFLSQHIGDLENAETLASFEQSIAHLGRLFRVTPEIIAHDLHPDYLSTRWAARAPLPASRVPVQHHHAHIAACMADNGLDGARPLIGLAFDGTGYGTDGAIWGGEVLVADYRGFERAAHLEYLPLPGGDAAIRKPWRTALGYLTALDIDTHDLPFLRAIDARAIDVVQAQVHKRLNAPLTSSLGRLFDAVAALAGLRGEVSYEAQAAIELETLAARDAHAGAAAPYPYRIDADGAGWIVRLGDLLAAVADDARPSGLRSGRGAAPGHIGARFHRTLAALALDLCRRVRAAYRFPEGATGLSEVALSGGVWQNRLLLELTRADLRAEGFTVYTHRQTPPNDGGLALGQAAIAAHVGAGLAPAPPTETHHVPRDSR